MRGIGGHTAFIESRHRRESEIRVFLTQTDTWSISWSVLTRKIDKPYFDAWLRRTGRQLAVSGRLTQTAMVLAAEEGGTVDEWRARLRTLLEGDEIPSLDLLVRIDAILAAPAKISTNPSSQGMLFE